MKKMKKSFCILLVLTMALGLLSGCGDNADNPKSTPTPDAPEYVYAPTYTELAGDFNYINQSYYSNGRILFYADVNTGETITQSYETGMLNEAGEPIMEEYTYEETRAGLFSMAADGTDIKELTDYVNSSVPQDPDNQYAGYSHNSINQIFGDSEGNIWLVDNVYSTTFNFPAGYEPPSGSGYDEEAWQYAVQEDEYYLVKLDSNGAELSRTDLAELVASEDQYFYVNNLTVDNEGNIYIVASSVIYVLDSTGQKLFQTESTDSWIEGIFVLTDGRVIASVYDQNTGDQQLKTIDLETKAFGTESYPCPYNAYNFMPGGGKYDYYYNNNASLFGVELETGESEKILTWINCDVDSSNLSSIIPLEDGSIVAMSRDYSSDEPKVELITMKLTPYDETNQKETITFACMWLNYNLRSEIIKFNRANTEYRIEVVDYSEYNTEEDYGAGQTKLTAEIISGQVPDIFATDGLPIEQYGAKGLLEDIWPYIDADTKLGGREGVVQPIFDALSTEEGKLYQLVPSAALYAVVGATSVVGSETGWTVDDALAALATMPEGCEMFQTGTDQASALSSICAMSLDSFVDWETGECTFDTDEFTQLLEFAKIFPAEFDWDAYYEGNGGMYDDEYLRIMQGRQMLASTYLHDLSYYSLYKKAFGGDITAVGFPGSTSGTAFSPNTGLAMSASCKNKEGAWEFMSVLLGDEYQQKNSYNGIPTNKKVLDEQIEELMKKEYYTDYETGEQVEQPKMTWWLDDDNQIQLFAMTQEDVDEIMELVNNTTRIYAYDDNLYEIIVEECAAFFAGQKTAADTAKNVQSRVSLYVNEQR